MVEHSRFDPPASAPAGILPAAGTATPAASLATGGRSLRIVVIESEPLVALAIRETVEDLGHTVCGIARCESEAVDLVGLKRPDLVLLSAHLPGAVDGIEVARRLHAGFGVRSVYLSAQMDHAMMARITSSYPLGVVQAPFSRGQLRTTLDLAARRLRAPPPPVTPE